MPDMKGKPKNEMEELNKLYAEAKASGRVVEISHTPSFPKESSASTTSSTSSNGRSSEEGSRYPKTTQRKVGCFSSIFGCHRGRVDDEDTVDSRYAHTSYESARHSR
mmetsp:Transcript_723/g.1547  ORF Transcript_723/g.1547 Transcript_723/m.1547 type:complete len:107 (-) Transcript_723:68-388(-)|eukprot:766438-Hanusia_phi.AAC.4